MSVLLRCDACSKPPYNHDGCTKWVRAFVDPDGPDTYACECSCNTRRRAEHDANCKVRQVLDAYRSRYGTPALEAILGDYSGSTEEAPDGR